MQFLQFPEVTEQPDSADDAFPALIEPPGEAGLQDDSEGEQDNQSHLSASEGEGKAEKSLLTSDVQVDDVVSAKASETCPSAEEEYPGEEQPRRSRRRRKERIYYPSKQERRSRKQKSQAK